MDVTCPQCGRPVIAGGGPFCSYCGSYLAPLQWVAEPPPVAGPQPRSPQPPYSGPPRYHTIPRWGFPPLPWYAAVSHARSVDPLDAARSLAGIAAPLLWATTAVALLAAVAESWRYALLVASREGALSARMVAVSDAFVVSAGTIALVIAALAGIALIAWTLRAAAAAAARTGVRMPRSPREMLVGWLVPGLNLAVPGILLAEIEHMALGRSPGTRPQLSRLLRVWWGLWGAGGVFAAVVFAWSWRDGVQAMADGVVLHAALDVLAAAVAATSALVVVRLTWLLEPLPVAKREILVRVPEGDDRRRDRPAGSAVTPSPEASPMSAG